MLKNDQWGAIAYLSTSIYGKGTTQIYRNDCYITSPSANYNGRTGWGAAGLSPLGGTTDCVSGINDAGAYHTAQGQQASSTGNLYGIYDLAGGNWEYTMGNFNNMVGLSEFSTLPAPKFFNAYLNPPFSGNYLSSNNQCTWVTCGGQALHETKVAQSISTDSQTWNNSSSDFVDSSVMWFIRGARSINLLNPVIFATDNHDGSATSWLTFRVVLGEF
jgi:hypothetical protein